MIDGCWTAKSTIDSAPCVIDLPAATTIVAECGRQISNRKG
ncbi:hypothetical protein RESH_01110 [Rhodopirellula europaea SH398]|uniref:Uncharacterized protein n=1 Tax=Rhodopirellula europaea SH398 TaxID=1263868 RepID=M5SPX6_9BACT|nr:hypothetical protein RESH_01110 [Rhodopirellula europaea SH398]